MYIEVLYVDGSEQRQRFYGPFETEEARKSFKKIIEEQYESIEKSFGYRNSVNHVKYISCDVLPPGNWVSIPSGVPEVLYWLSKKDTEEWSDEARRRFNI